MGEAEQNLTFLLNITLLFMLGELSTGSGRQLGQMELEQEREIQTFMIQLPMQFFLPFDGLRLLSRSRWIPRWSCLRQLQVSLIGIYRLAVEM